VRPDRFRTHSLVQKINLTGPLARGLNPLLRSAAGARVTVTKGGHECSALPIDQVHSSAGRAPERNIDAIVGHVVCVPDLDVLTGGPTSVEEGIHPGYSPFWCSCDIRR
jgi:hypothetical protein